MSTNINTVIEKLELAVAEINRGQLASQNRADYGRLLSGAHAAEREIKGALDRLQAQQSNAEPVAWAYFGDFPDGKRLISADNTNLWGSDGIPLYTHPPASTEHPSYVYSRDYEALYDLLMRGGEALGRQWNHPGTRIVIPTDIRPLHVPQWQHMMMLDKARFAKVCSEMNLEWIAPSTEPRLTVKQAMEACAAANVEWSLGGYKGTKKREWADEYKRMLRDRLIKAARP